MGLLGSIAAVALGGVKAGGAFIGAKSQKKAAKKAGQFVQTAADNNNALAREQFTPYTQAGAGAMGQANALLGLGGQEAQTGAFQTFRDSSGYQFIRDQALDGVNSQYAGRGVLQSGAAAQALQDRAGQVATQNAFMPYMGYLQNQAGLGLGASNALVGNVSNNNIYAADGQANAALIRGNSNPFAAALGQISGTFAGGGNPLASLGLKF